MNFKNKNFYKQKIKIFEKILIKFNLKFKVF